MCVLSDMTFFRAQVGEERVIVRVFKAGDLRSDVGHAIQALKDEGVLPQGRTNWWWSNDQVTIHVEDTYRLHIASISTTSVEELSENEILAFRDGFICCKDMSYKTNNPNAGD